MKLSAAWKFARRGKSANDVFAARIKINVVATWSARNNAYPSAPWPKIARPTWEMTVFVSVGTTCSFTVMKESPRNIRPRRLPIHINVVRAFFHSTGLNAGTPFETASTPVTAAPPDAKAFKMMNRVTAPVACAMSGGTGSGWRLPVNSRKSPIPSIRNIMKMKKYVGNANIRPDSRTPRRFPHAMNQMQKTDIHTR